MSLASCRRRYYYSRDDKNKKARLRQHVNYSGVVSSSQSQSQPSAAATRRVLIIAIMTIMVSVSHAFRIIISGTTNISFRRYHNYRDGCFAAIRPPPSSSTRSLCLRLSSKQTNSNNNNNKFDNLMDDILRGDGLLQQQQQQQKPLGDDDSKETTIRISDSRTSVSLTNNNIESFNQDDDDVSINTVNNNNTNKKWKTIPWESLMSDQYYDYSSSPKNDTQTCAILHHIDDPSPVDVIVVPVLHQGIVVHVKRDDQLKLPGSQVSGNKARKMFALDNLKDDYDFPTCVVSYGGPQSNAMLALAAIVHFQNAKSTTNNNDQEETTNNETEINNKNAEKHRFVYYCKKLPKFLRTSPSGNLFRAQMLGMELVELPPAEYKLLFGGDAGGSQDPPPGLEPPVPGESVWIPQGGACAMALEGTKRLALEIYEYWAARRGNQDDSRRPISIIVPGGTCSTALFLHRALKDIAASAISWEPSQNHLNIEVVVVPCIADGAYARRQMMSLNLALGVDPLDLPVVLDPSPPTQTTYFGQVPSGKDDGYFQFGEPQQEILETFLYMKEECDLPLDLLYGAPAWSILFRHWKAGGNTDSDRAASHLTGRDVMYIHSGGLEGVNSQLLRYKYKGLVALDDVQIPGKSSKSP